VEALAQTRMPEEDGEIFGSEQDASQRRQIQEGSDQIWQCLNIQNGCKAIKNKNILITDSKTKNYI